MICRETEGWLIERLAGTLTAQQAETLEAHLAVCPACRRSAVRLKGSVRQLQQAFAGLEPTDLTAAVLERVRTPEPTLWRRWAPAFAGGALAICLSLAFLLGSRPGLSDQELFQDYAEDLTSLGWSQSATGTTAYPLAETNRVDGLPDTLFGSN
jgi:anti-sigma factor RsiW